MGSFSLAISTNNRMQSEICKDFSLCKRRICNFSFDRKRVFADMRYIILISLLLLFVLSCNNNPVTPPEDQSGRRDYVWTIDTISSFDIISRLWGSSPTDLWAITSSNPYESIYHFDGTKWTTDGIFRLWAPSSIYGFNSKNIYIGGQRGKIYKYDGNNWSEIASLEKDGHSDIVFSNMWGESIFDLTYNLFATGAYPEKNGYLNNSVIAHYVNNKWEILNTDSLYGLVSRIFRNPVDNKVYILTIGGHNYTDSTTIWVYDQGNYHKLYSNIWVQGLQADLSFIGREVYFIMGNKIAIRNNNQFQTIITVDNPKFYQRIWGRNSKDIFLLMTDGLAHYNGTDIEYLFYFNVTQKTQIYGASLFENDVFFLVSEAQTTLNLIYHGKL